MDEWDVWNYDIRIEVGSDGQSLAMDSPDGFVISDHVTLPDMEPYYNEDCIVYTIENNNDFDEVSFYYDPDKELCEIWKIIFSQGDDDVFIAYNPDGFGPSVPELTPEWLNVINVLAGDDLVSLNSDYYGDRAKLLRGGPGDDMVFGGMRAEELFGDDGNDQVFGRAGDDKLYGGIGDDAIAGEHGNDEVWGGEGNDVLFGHAGADRLYGDDGDDRLNGAKGKDELWGGLGRDKFVFGKKYDRDTIHDFTAGEDLILIKNGAKKFKQVMKVAKDTDTGVVLNFKGKHDLVIEGVTTTSLTSADFDF